MRELCPKLKSAHAKYISNKNILNFAEAHEALINMKLMSNRSLYPLIPC